MALYICGTTLADPTKRLSKLDAFLEAYHCHLEKGAEELKSSLHVDVSLKDTALYVHQREFAILTPDSKITKIGTDMATTCHIVVVRCPITKVTALGHFDGRATSQGVNDLVNGIVKEVVESGGPKQHEIALDLHIIGGFNDKRHLSEELSLELLEEFNCYTGNDAVKLHLKTFCATSLNNITVTVNKEKLVRKEVNGPAILGILMDLATGNMCRATFHEVAKQPLTSLRSARSLNGVRSMANVYRSKEDFFIMEPFTYEPMYQVEAWLEQPDQFIRKHMSTSPDVEPVSFEEHIRQTLQFLQAHPDPMKTVFQDQKPLIFHPIFTEEGLAWKERTEMQ